MLKHKDIRIMDLISNQSLIIPIVNKNKFDLYSNDGPFKQYD